MSDNSATGCNVGGINPQRVRTSTSCHRCKRRFCVSRAEATSISSIHGLFTEIAREVTRIDPLTKSSGNGGSRTTLSRCSMRATDFKIEFRAAIAEGRLPLRELRVAKDGRFVSRSTASSSSLDTCDNYASAVSLFFLSRPLHHLPLPIDPPSALSSLAVDGATILDIKLITESTCRRIPDAEVFTRSCAVTGCRPGPEGKSGSRSRSSVALPFGVSPLRRCLRELSLQRVSLVDAFHPVASLHRATFERVVTDRRKNHPRDGWIRARGDILPSFYRRAFRERNTRQRVAARRRPSRSPARQAFARANLNCSRNLRDAACFRASSRATVARGRVSLSLSLSRGAEGEITRREKHINIPIN